MIKLDKFLTANNDKLTGQALRVSDEHVGELDVFNKPNGFPTIVILDDNGEKKKDFNGPRTMDGFLKFLISNGVYSGGMKGGKKTIKKSRKSKKSKKSKKTAKKARKSKTSRKH